MNTLEKKQLEWEIKIQEMLKNGLNFKEIQ